MSYTGCSDPLGGEITHRPNINNLLKYKNMISRHTFDVLAKDYTNNISKGLY